MLGKIIGAAALVGLGYLGYRVYLGMKSGAGGSSSSSASSLSPQEQENAAYLAQKYIPGYTDSSGLQGGCMGCMGSASVQIL